MNSFSRIRKFYNFCYCAQRKEKHWENPPPEKGRDKWKSTLSLIVSGLDSNGWWWWWSDRNALRPGARTLVRTHTWRTLKWQRERLSGCDCGLGVWEEGERRRTDGNERWIRKSEWLNLDRGILTSFYVQFTGKWTLLTEAVFIERKLTDDLMLLLTSSLSV